MLDAAGCDAVLVETVGVGQSEVAIAGAADTTVVLLAPGMGDGIQAAKAGILEVGDVYVVNKADRDGADIDGPRAAPHADAGGAAGPEAWQPPVVKTVASRGEGLDELVAALDGHGAWLVESGMLDERRRHRVRTEVEALALGILQRRLANNGLDALAARVLAGELDPYTAADLAVASA